MTDPKSFIGMRVKVTIDRQLGTKHPEFDWKYPINYGFIPDTISGDGKELDAYILGIDVPLKSFEGTCIAIALREDDDDPKLVIVPKGTTMSDEEIIEAIHFQEQWFKTIIKR